MTDGNINLSSAQLRARLVGDMRLSGRVRSEAVASAFLSVPRELFVTGVAAEQGLDAVYRDEAHVIKRSAEGMPLSSSSQPSLMAEMLEMLDPRPGQRVLEIGAGSGYNAGLLRQMVGARGRVTSIDVDRALASGARRALRAAGLAVTVVAADGRDGWPRAAPYDRIIVTASAAEISSAWFDQLTDAGRLVLPLRLDEASAAIQLIPALERHDDRLDPLAVTWGGFMPLHGGRGGWDGLPPSLGASRSAGRGGTMLAGFSGPGISLLSDATARSVLVAALDGRRAGRTRGHIELAAGRLPSLIMYLVLRIPAKRRVWLSGGDRLAVGLVGKRRRGVAVVSMPSPWPDARTGRRAAGPGPASRRVSWRIDGFADDCDAVAELEGHVSAWRRLEREGRTQLAVSARRAEPAMQLRFRWTR